MYFKITPLQKLYNLISGMMIWWAINQHTGILLVTILLVESKDRLCIHSRLRNNVRGLQSNVHVHGILVDEYSGHISRTFVLYVCVH